MPIISLLLSPEGKSAEVEFETSLPPATTDGRGGRLQSAFLRFCSLSICFPQASPTSECLIKSCASCVTLAIGFIHGKELVTIEGPHTCFVKPCIGRNMGSVSGCPSSADFNAGTSGEASGGLVSNLSRCLSTCNWPLNVRLRERLQTFKRISAADLSYLHQSEQQLTSM